MLSLSLGTQTKFITKLQIATEGKSSPTKQPKLHSLNTDI